jgi:MATE family multidrug resistance protein
MTDLDERPGDGLLAEVRRIATLALPMMVAQGGLVAMGLVDTLLIGRVSALEMSAVGLGNAIVSLIVVFGVGVAMGIEPLVAQAHGAGEGVRAHRWLAQGTYAALLASAPLALLVAVAGFMLEPFGIEPAIAHQTRLYLWARVPGLVANGVYSAHRSYLSGVGLARPVLMASLIANGVNAVVDAVLLFVFGLGAVGVGLATSASWVLMAWILVRAARFAAPPGQPRWPSADRSELTRVFAIGSPVGLQYAAEVGIFSLASILVARLGPEPLAGHQIALTLASFTFMAAVGLSVASAARVGFFIGREEPARAIRAGRIGIALGAAFMGACGLLFYIFRHALGAAFAPRDPGVAEIGAQLLAIAAVFSVADGVQTVAAGALRGAGDTRAAFVLNLVAHWGIGLPVALLLGLVWGLGARGLWWGLTAGLVAVAIGLVVRFEQRVRRPLERL